MIKNLIAPVLLCLAALGALIGLEVGAFAQALPPDPGAQDILTQLLAAFTAKNYVLLGMLVTAGIVWVAEHVLVQVIPSLADPRPSALLALGMSIVVAIVNGIAASTGITVVMVVSYVIAGLTAWGGLPRLVGLFTGSTGNAGVKL